MSSSIGMMTFPIYGKISVMFQSPPTSNIFQHVPWCPTFTLFSQSVFTAKQSQTSTTATTFSAYPLVIQQLAIEAMAQSKSGSFPLKMMPMVNLSSSLRESLPEGYISWISHQYPIEIPIQMVTFYSYFDITRGYIPFISHLITINPIKSLSNPIKDHDSFIHAPSTI